MECQQVVTKISNQVHQRYPDNSADELHGTDTPDKGSAVPIVQQSLNLFGKQKNRSIRKHR